MASIGDRLREARTRRGLDFDDVETATKIRARYLRALEAEQFDLLPGPTFARTFLRTYAEYLGLDARLLVEEYRTHHEPRDEVFETASSPVASSPRERLPAMPMWRPGPIVLLGGGAAAVIVFLIVLGLVAGAPSPEQAEPPRSTPDRAAAEREREARARRRRPPPAEPTSVALRIAPVVPTYVCVEDASGQTRFEGTLSQPRRWRGRRLSINLGKRSPRIDFNGRRVRGFDRSLPTPIAFEFRPPWRQRQLPPGQGPCTS